MRRSFRRPLTAADISARAHGVPAAQSAARCHRTPDHQGCHYGSGPRRLRCHPRACGQRPVSPLPASRPATGQPHPANAPGTPPGRQRRTRHPGSAWACSQSLKTPRQVHRLLAQLGSEQPVPGVLVHLPGDVVRRARRPPGPCPGSRRLLSQVQRGKLGRNRGPGIDDLPTARDVLSDVPLTLPPAGGDGGSVSRRSPCVAPRAVPGSPFPSLRARRRRRRPGQGGRS